MLAFAPVCGWIGLWAAARGRFGIVDGQHRVGALRVLFGRGEFDQRVLMEVIPLPTDAAVRIGPTATYLMYRTSTLLRNYLKEQGPRRIFFLLKVELPMPRQVCTEP